MNTYLKYQPPALQFLSFLGLAFGFFTLSYVVSRYFFYDINAVLLDKDAVVNNEGIARFKLAQLVSTILSFILPAFLFGYYSSPKALPYIGIQKTISALLIILSVLLLVFIQPFVGWLGQINAKIDFGSMQKELQNAEAVYTRALEVFLKMTSVKDLLINLFVMAFVPAIGEELFFRGALQNVLLRMTNKPWLAILMASGIFALMHGTFFKIFPIFVLGIMLGLIYHFTRNLWYTITIHFLNNALAVLAFYYSNRSEIISKFANDNINVPLYSAVFSLVIVTAIMYYLKKKSYELVPNVITNDDDDYIAS